MRANSLPLFNVPAVISSHRTIFHAFDEKVIVEAPGNLIRKLVELCDGSITFEEVIQRIKGEWDEESMRGLIEDMFQKNLLINARNLGEEAWKAIENPMRFPMIIGEKDVVELVRVATERHRSDSDKCPYRAKTSSHGSLIAQRQSTRSFSGAPVPFQSIINMLWSAYGEYATKDGSSHRTSPSAGALYPLLIHVALFTETDKLQPSVYRVCYDSSGNVGLKLASKDVLQFARSFLNPAGILKGIHGVIVISGSFSITGEKYGNRSMLYVPLEAGHAAQNILLEAVEHDVATLEIGGFVDKFLGEAIDLPLGYRPLTAIAFGEKANALDIVVPKSTLEVEWAIPVAGQYCPSFAIASARVSAQRSWSHGRDASPIIALTKAVAEAKEWAACGRIPDLVRARFGELESAVDPRDIIKFHPAQYRVKYFPFAPFDENREYAWTKGYEAVTGSKAYILADHVYFPYFPDTPYYAFANSSGCAAHPDEQTAIETATLELVERDAFMNAYLCKLALPTVEEKTFPGDIRKRIADLQSLGFKVWIKDHSLDCAPVAFVFAQNKELAFTTCASCASFDIAHAVSHALMEVEASVLSRLQNGPAKPTRPDEVVMPLDHGRLYGQKQYFRNADFLVHCGDRISFGEIGGNVAHSWNELLDRFAYKGWRLFVIPLHLSDEYGGNGDLYIIRSVVPGMVPMTFGYRQEPAGMERIYAIAEAIGNKKLSYGELTKFPHPFE